MRRGCGECHEQRAVVDSDINYYSIAMGIIKNFEELVSHSEIPLRRTKTPERKMVLEIIEAGLEAIQPENIIGKNVSLEGRTLKIKNASFDISGFQNIFLLGFGKGSAKISRLIEEILGERLTEGFVIDVAPIGPGSRIEAVLGTHPLPSQTNLDFTKKVIDRFEQKLSEKDLVIVIVTGGGSALFELPHSLSLNELIKKNDELLKSGLTITQMNEERKKLSKVKGGGLAKILYPAKVVSLIFSDVPGNDLGTVTSGPTVKGVNATDDKYFQNVTNILVLNNDSALFAMMKKAEELGIYCSIFSNDFEADAEIAGKKLIGETKPNSVLIAGGETHLKVTGGGKGGRNQHLVLSALNNLAIEQFSNTVIAAFDSDGWDNTEFAGAIGDVQTLKKAKDLNLDIQKYLNEHDSFSFFEKAGDGIITGRLASNISDLFVVYKFY